MTADGSATRRSAEDVERARASVADIGKRARATNAARAAQIEALLMAAVAGEPPTEDGLRGAERAAHMIAGSAGTIGLHQVSELARDLETSIAGGSLLDPPVLLHAVAVLRDIQRRLEAETGERQAAVEPTRQGRRELLLVAPEGQAASAVLAEAEARGWSARLVTDPGAARVVLRSGRPAVVVLDTAAETAETGLLAGGPDRPRVAVVLVGDGDADARADAVRSGADRFVDRARGPAAVVTAAVDAAGLPPVETSTVLAVAAGEVANALEAALSGPAFELTTLSSPAAVGGRPPDLLVLDVRTRSGLEASRAAREDPRWAGVPVLAVVGGRDGAPGEALGAGADDVVRSPIDPAELLARVSVLLERGRLRNALRLADPATGVANRGATAAAFDRLSEESQRVGTPLSVAVIDVDAVRALNEDHGYEFGDAVIERVAALLRTSVRRGDVVGRWGGQEFVVLMKGQRRADGVARIAAVLESLRNHRFVTADGEPAAATFSAAVAEVPGDGNELTGLVRELNRVVAAAKRAGGNRVLPLGWRPQAVRNTTDVFIVEDDEMLAGLLQQALDTRGLRSEHEVDGKVALDRLIGPNRLSARVILLDVDLPGMNGLDVLRRLESEGVLAHSHVIMLTAYASEEDVVTAMRHGAFDHAAKPFSLPVLTQRLRRALDSLPTS